MVFSIVFGISIGREHSSTEKILNLIAEKYEKIPKQSTNKQVICTCTSHKEKIVSYKYKIQLYNDIITCHGESIFTINEEDIENCYNWDIHFHYRKDTNITIGSFNDYLFTISCANYSPYDDKFIDLLDVSDETLTNLIEWKKELIEQGRISPTSSIGFVCN